MDTYRSSISWLIQATYILKFLLHHLLLFMFHKMYLSHILASWKSYNPMYLSIIHYNMMGGKLTFTIPHMDFHIGIILQKTQFNLWLFHLRYLLNYPRPHLYIALDSPDHIALGKFHMSFILVHSPSKANSLHTHTKISIVEGKERREISFQDMHPKVQGEKEKEGKRPLYMYGPIRHP